MQQRFSRHLHSQGPAGGGVGNENWNPSLYDFLNVILHKDLYSTQCIPIIIHRVS